MPATSTTSTTMASPPSRTKYRPKGRTPKADNAPPLDRSLMRGLWAHNLIGLGYAPSTLMSFFGIKKTAFYADLARAEQALEQTAEDVARRDALEELEFDERPYDPYFDGSPEDSI